MSKRNLKYHNNYNLIFQIRQEIYCLGFYHSKGHDTFVINISTSQVNRTGNILQDAAFCNHKNMNILWEMTLVLYIVAYFLKYSILPDRKCQYYKQFLLSIQRAMPLLSKRFDAYLFN